MKSQILFFFFFFFFCCCFGRGGGGGVVVFFFFFVFFFFWKNKKIIIKKKKVLSVKKLCFVKRLTLVGKPCQTFFVSKIYLRALNTLDRIFAKGNNICFSAHHPLLKRGLP